MGGLHAPDDSLASRGFGSPWLQASFFNAAWASTSAWAGIMPTFLGVIPHACTNCRPGVGLRAIPVRASIRAAAAATVVGGCGRNSASIVARCRGGHGAAAAAAEVSMTRSPP
jgi:hypothetical protein